MREHWRAADLAARIALEKTPMDGEGYVDCWLRWTRIEDRIKARHWRNRHPF